MVVVIEGNRLGAAGVRSGMYVEGSRVLKSVGNRRRCFSPPRIPVLLT